MKISSFDIFDTCLVRKCGTPENFFDVFSLRAFEHEPQEWARQELVAARRLTEQKLWNKNPHYTLQDIWAEMDWSHPFLKSKEELCELEQELEREMLVPVLSMRDKVSECRKRGDKIIFISDMYLSAAFLIDVMRAHGFYQEGDALYVSCECKAAKYNGELFRYVKEKEGLSSFRNWHHYGDNDYSDIKIAKQLGITTHKVYHPYSPYQKYWKDNDFSLGYHSLSIAAGLSRAIRYNERYNRHTDFVLDLASPFNCSFAYRIMRNAVKHDIKRLYFAARDTWAIYHIAKRMQVLFPLLEIKFIYMSKKSLYEGDETLKWQYFEQEGLATKTDKVALVDIRSSGKTLRYLNECLPKRGYMPVRGYLFETCAHDNMDNINANCYAEILHPYIKPFSVSKILSGNLLYEQLFGLNTLARTIDYRISDDGKVVPLFDNEDKLTQNEDKFKMDGIEIWSEYHLTTMMKYTDWYIELGLYKYSDDIFNKIAVPSLFRFFYHPNDEYLFLLEDMYGKKYGDERWYPYVKKESMFELLLTKGKNTMWKHATLVYSLPNWLYKILYNIKHR